MDILYLLVPLSVVAMLAILGGFAWALYGGQFDDLDAIAAQILDADADAPPRDAALDTDQYADDLPDRAFGQAPINNNRSAA
jgi:cbb3-type cytochrome oxidase maturation protein